MWVKYIIVICFKCYDKNVNFHLKVMAKAQYDMQSEMPFKNSYWITVIYSFHLILYYNTGGWQTNK